MAYQVSNHTVPSVAGRVQHALFPSRRMALIALAVEVGALLIGVPPAAHVLLAVITHAMIALAQRH